MAESNQEIDAAAQAAVRANVAGADEVVEGESTGQSTIAKQQGDAANEAMGAVPPSANAEKATDPSQLPDAALDFAKRVRWQYLCCHRLTMVVDVLTPTDVRLGSKWRSNSN